MEQEHREQRPLLVAAELNEPVLVGDFERPEDPELQHPFFVTPSENGGKGR